MDLKQHIRGIPDFPKPGILFYDISTLLKHPGAWKETVAEMTEALRPLKPDLLAGIESRGFPDRRPGRRAAGLRLCHDPQERQASGQDHPAYL